MKGRYLLTVISFCLFWSYLGINAEGPTVKRLKSKNTGRAFAGEENLKHESLGHFNVHKDKITLSGFSSGGTFAQHLQMSHSSLFYGLATLGHAYYRCGPGNGNENDYDDACTIITANKTYNYKLALNDIREYEKENLIESTQNLRNQRLYVYAASQSSFFSLEQSLAVIDVYKPFIQNSAAIRKRVENAAQVLPTVNFGTPCQESGTLETFYLGNCGFSVAHDALQFLLGDDVIHSPPNGVKAKMENLRIFSQTEFFIGLSGKSLMDTVGYIYVPTNCKNNYKCMLHFYFHGCLTGREFNGPSHLVNSGYLELAEANDIIIVAPQATGNEVNKIGCWDTYGLTGKYYATKRGLQVAVVRSILARILNEENTKANYKTVKQTTPNSKNGYYNGNENLHLSAILSFVVVWIVVFF